MKRALVTIILIITISVLYTTKASIIDSPELPPAPPKTITPRIKEWQDPINGQFNEVRVVCVPRSVALTGAAHSMKKIGADRTFPMPSNEGYCYVKFFYNPSKPAYAQQKCGGRTRLENSYAYSSLNQMPCWITYLDNSEDIQDKVENPLDYARYVDTIYDAINYLQTGLQKIVPIAPPLN